MVKFYISNLAHDGTLISTYECQELKYSFRVNDKGTISWSLAISQTDTNGVPIQPDEFGPKFTDYKLSLSTDGGTTLQPITSGFLWSVNLQSDSGLINCSGIDW